MRKNLLNSHVPAILGAQLVVLPFGFVEAEAGEEKIALGAGLTVVGQGMSGGTDDTGLSYSADIALEADFGDRGNALIYINTAQGAGIDTGAATGPNADNESGDLVAEGYSESRIAEAWYQFPFSEAVSLTVGKIDPTGLYDANEIANDETAQFLADAFVNNPAIAFPGYAGGASLSITPADSVAINLGLFENTGDFSGELSSAFMIAELALSGDVGGRDGNVRLTTWQEDVTDNKGFAINADFAASENFVVMARLGTQEDTQAFDNAFSIGGQLAMGGNTLGAAYSLLTATATGADDESQAEIYYSHALTDNVHVTADLQFVANPNFDSAADDVTVYGVRGQIDL